MTYYQEQHIRCTWWPGHCRSRYPAAESPAGCPGPGGHSMCWQDYCGPCRNQSSLHSHGSDSTRLHTATVPGRMALAARHGHRRQGRSAGAAMVTVTSRRRPGKASARRAAVQQPAVPVSSPSAIHDSLAAIQFMIRGPARASGPGPIFFSQLE